MAKRRKELIVHEPVQLDWAQLPMPAHWKEITGIITVYHSIHHYRGNSFAFDHLMGRHAKTVEEYVEEKLDAFSK